MAKPSGAAQRSSLFWRTYLMTWLGCAIIAAAYMSFVLTRPSAIDRLVASPPIASMKQSTHRDQLADEDQQEELKVLRRTVRSLRSKLSEMETRVAANAQPATQSATEASPQRANTESEDRAPIPRVVPSTRSNNAGPGVVSPHDTTRFHAAQSNDAQSDVVMSHLVQPYSDQSHSDQSNVDRPYVAQSRVAQSEIVQPNVFQGHSNGHQLVPDDSVKSRPHATPESPLQFPAQATVSGEPLNSPSQAVGTAQNATRSTPPTNSARRRSGEPPLPERGPARQLARLNAPTRPGDSAHTIATGSIDRTSDRASVNPRLPGQGYSARRPSTQRSSVEEHSISSPRVIASNGRQITTKPSPDRSNRASITPEAAVVLSAAASIEGLRASWYQLATLHPALLGTLRPRYDAMGRGGPYRLLAGPLTDRVEADRLCTALRAHEVQCAVAAFVGNAL